MDNTENQDSQPVKKSSKNPAGRQKIVTKAQESQYKGMKFVCNKCGKNLAIESNYFKLTKNDLCRYAIYPICKKCLREEFEKERFNNGDRMALRYILRRLDKPYIEEIVERAFERDKNDILGYTLKVLNGLSQYSNLCYDDSDFIKSKGITEVDNKMMSVVEKEFTDDDWARWTGYGLEPADLKACNDYYIKIIDKYEFDSLNDEMAVEQLAVLNVKLKKAFKDDDTTAIEKLRKTISSIEADLNISAKQKKDDMGKDTFGNFIKMIENEEPIPETRDEFKDVDKIWNLVKRYVVGYLPVMLGKAREQDVLQEDEDILDKYED